MSDSIVISEIKNKLSSKIDVEPDVKSTPTSPMTTRWKFRSNGLETIKNSASEPNVSVINETIKTAVADDATKRNSKSEDCLLDLDKPSDNNLSSASKVQSCEDNTLDKCKEKPVDDIFARALKERLGLKTDVATPGRVMVLNDGSGGGGAAGTGAGAGEGGGLITPRRLVNPCLESSPRQDLHRELLFNQKIGKNVLNQKSELERALSKHKEKQVISQQEKEHKKTPELERAIAERAKRLEESMNNKNESDKIEAAVNPQYIEARNRLRHAK